MKGHKGIDDYLQKIPHNIHSMVLSPTSQIEVKKSSMSYQQNLAVVMMT